MDENISRAAGASHGQELDDAELPRDRRAARPSARAAHDALRPHHDRGPAAAAAPASIERASHGIAGQRSGADAREPRRLTPPRRRRHRQRARRRAEPREPTTFLDEHGLDRGRDGAHRRRAGRDALRGDGPGDGDLRRLGREHHGRASRRSAGAPRSSVGSRDDQLGAVFAHDIRAAGVAASTTPPATDGAPDRALPDHRHARRRAHAEHVPRCGGRARSRRRRRRPRRATRRSPTSRATSGTSRRPRRRSATRRGSRTRPGDASRSRCPTASASTGTATTSSTSSSTRSTSSSPTRTRSASLYEVDDFDDALQHVHAPLRDRRAHPEREGLGRS